MSSEPKYTQIQCSLIGLAGTTPVCIKESPPGTFCARMGGSMFGHCNMSEEEFKKCGYDPFHPEFRDNFFQGIGSSPEEAIEVMKADMKIISDMMWA